MKVRAAETRRPTVYVEAPGWWEIARTLALYAAAGLALVVLSWVLMAVGLMLLAAFFGA